MKKIFLTVGPSQLYPTVPGHIRQGLKDNIGSISHRSAQFSEIYKEASGAVRTLLDVPPDRHVFFFGSATEAMERILENTVEKYSYHFVNGTFSKKFYTIATQLKKQAEIYEVPLGLGFDLKKANISPTTELICITQNETTGGTDFPMEDVYKLKKLYPKAFIAMDIVSSVPYVKIDFSKVDMVFFSVQKGIGLPAGLGVAIINNAALEKAQYLLDKGLSIGSFHNFLILAEKEKKFQTHETPNVFEIYLLGKTCNDMITEGIDKIRKETEIKAKMIYDFFDKSKFRPFVSDTTVRSKTTIVIGTNGNSVPVLKYLAEKGFVVSSGYAEMKEKQIRIANFPSIKISMIKKFLKAFASME